MLFGVAMFCTDYTIGPGALARGVEARGFDLLLFPEHTHIPASRETPYPDGGELPREYAHTLDPFVSLTAAACATSKLLIGTGICLVVERDPIVLAKAVSTLDQISNGRFVFGVGGGWNREEMAHHGTEYATRWILLRERIEAMQTLWTQEEASYHGRFVDFDRVWQWPKPIQRPHPPILVAGDGARTLERVVRYGDEWLPPIFVGPRRFQERYAQLQELAVAAGREPIPATLFGCPPDASVVAEFARLGAKRVVFWMPPSSPTEAEAHLDAYAAIAAQYD